MDYVDWADRVWQAASTCWVAANEGVKLSGFSYAAVAPTLGLQANKLSTDAAQFEAWQALAKPLRELSDLGLLTLDHEYHSAAFYRVSSLGQHLLGKSLAALWPAIFANASLLEDQLTFLRGVVRLGQRETNGYVILQSIFAEDVLEDIGWAHDDQVGHRATYLTRFLSDVGLVKIDDAPVGGDYEISPTYKGCVYATRHLESAWAPVIRQCVADGETTNVEFKGELVLGSDRQKAEFVKDILGLTNTKSSGQRLLLIGFDKTSYAPIEWGDQSIDQDTMERLLGAWSSPPPDIHYQKLNYLGNVIGIIEVFRQRNKLPYRFRGKLWKMQDRTIYVRHGSQTVPLADDDPEALALITEGEKARANETQ